ncbi:hypothetical protein AOL_s00169g75 [Orbilia oligospora ATCC 24927]|uniref:Asteroid domain-containing protein n=1 Tax=Arthrobotrys oligospora (strain ATCC 24927 / CBS 115.81 / DSM 1491) TaxID=756982 RepID=G1XMM2_ARTOA|nr:hypothetical protein AOL_s00169g75 [Orbilia oligospora ATCC 24927]EGX45469.1 hypothetical protein AOL_s00169g75 [Orbilia oligospora ATCC 24927]
MGIPQLLQNLERIEKPKSKVFPKNSSSGDDPSRPAAVIDGSALAHHIFNRYVKSLSKEERIPSVLGFDYTAYQKIVINWLEKLETTIACLSRLRTLSPSVIDLTKGGWNPSPPFIIAAFSTAVRRHERFGRVLKTVAGEADAFCAAAAAATAVAGVGTGGEGRISVVFTGDSDLVVYPHSQYSRVAILDDVHFEYTPDEGSKVKVLLWSPWDIERKLGGGSSNDNRGEEPAMRIMKFAWCLVIKEVFRISKVVTSGKGDGLGGVKVGGEFREQYLLPDVQRFGDESLGGILDSRAAEVVYASPRFRGLCHPPVRESGKEAEVYLPVLLEDVTKSSVWSVGRETRKLAYQILFGMNAVVVEVHRKGEAVNRSFLTLEKEDEGLILGGEFGEGLNGLVVGVILEIVRGYLEKNIDITDKDLIALLAAVTKSPGHEESLPTATAVHWTWPRAHLLSQFMAGIWSLYLLQTVTNLPNDGVEIPETIDKSTFEKLKVFQSLLDIINVNRFMAIYAITYHPKGMSKSAKKRAKKRPKVSEGQQQGTSGLNAGIQGLINRMFEREVRGSVTGVLDIVREMRRRVDEDGEEEAESYMGMTVG